MRPRNVIRQPCSRSARPKIRSPRSCRSSGGQASTARGPPPRSHPRASPSRRPRMRCDAKRSCATDTSPLSQPSPSSRKSGSTAPTSTASSEKSARRRSNAVCDAASSNRRIASLSSTDTPSAAASAVTGSDSASRAASAADKRRCQQLAHLSDPGQRPRSKRAGNRRWSAWVRAGRNGAPTRAAGRLRPPCGARAHRCGVPRPRSSRQCTEFGQRFDKPPLGPVHSLDKP